MKNTSLALTVLIAFTGAAQAQPLPHAVDKPPLTYTQLVATTIRLQSDTNALLDELMARRVQLNLKRFGKGSDAYYQWKKDGFGFVCVTAERGFSGGRVQAMLVRYEPAEGGTSFYLLDNCRKVK